MFQFNHIIIVSNILTLCFLSFYMIFILLKDNFHYPLFLIQIFTNPFYRLVIYFMIYLITTINPTIGIVLLINVIILHIELINFSFI